MNAARTGCLLFLVAFHSSFAADAPPPEIRLAGLVSRDGKDLAVLEIVQRKRWGDLLRLVAERIGE